MVTWRWLWQGECKSDGETVSVNWVFAEILWAKPSLLIFSLRYNGPNLVLKYDRTQNRLVNIAVDDSNSPYYALRDRTGAAIGVTACDVDGDGREEIYFLNTNNAYSGNTCIPHSNEFSKFLPPTDRFLLTITDFF